MGRHDDPLHAELSDPPRGAARAGLRGPAGGAPARKRLSGRTRGASACAGLVSLVICSLLVGIAAADEGIIERRIDDVSDVPAEARFAMFEAQKERESGNPEAAIDILSEFLMDNPEQDHFLVRFHLALSWERRGDLEEAVTSYQVSVGMEPMFAQGWLNLGELAYNMGKYEMAAEALSRGYAASEWKDPNVLFFNAAALLMGGRAEEAVPLLTELTSGGHGEPTMEWHRALIMAHLELGNETEGVRAVDAMLSQFGSDPEAWRLAFRYFAGAGDYEGAAVALTVGGYLRPLTTDEEMTLGDLYLAVGVPVLASDLYASALEDSASAQDLERLASAYLASYDFEAALEALDRALVTEPTPRLWSLLGDLHFMQNEYAEAYSAYESAAAVSPEPGRALLMMGYCAIQLERNADAIEALERAVDYPGESGKANQLLTALRQLSN